MAAFAIVQNTIPTSIGTLDFTGPSGFGQPKGAIFFGTRAIANGTTVAHAQLWMGATDGTRNRAIVGRSESAIVLGTTDCTNDDSVLKCVITSATANGSRITAAAFDSWITDGVRINFTTAPAVAYKINCILIGGAEVSNVYVGNASTPSVVDTATDVTDPGFQPDAVLTFTHCGTIDEIAGANMSWSLGMVVRDGSNTQRSMSINETDGVATTAMVAMLDTNSVARRAAGGVGGAEAQISNFDASGFDLALKVLDGTAIDLMYVAIKLSGVSAKILTSASPTATGSHTITGAGFTPAFGLMFHSSCVAVDTVYADGNAEVCGISAFTTAASASAAYASDDNVSTTVTESITNYGATTSGVPVSLRKDSADFMTATFTTFTTDGVTFNYSVVDPATTARQRAVLFIQESSAYAAPIALQQQGGVMIGRRYV